MADQATTPASTTDSSSVTSRLHARIEWLLSPEHFQFKLLLGTALGVSVILILAVTCFVLTCRNQRQAEYRAQAISVIRLSSGVENDIAALENAHRGYLLAPAPESRGNFQQRQGLFQKHSEELTAALADDSQQRKHILKMREIVSTWLNEKDLAGSGIPQNEKKLPSQLSARLDATRLDAARDILASVQRAEQIGLNQRVRDKEWAAQSAQMLDFLPRLERAAYEMQKEERGFVLTGDNAFIESYNRATANFYTFYAHLSVLLADSPAQLAQLEAIRVGSENWIVKCAVPEIETKLAGRTPGAASSGQSEQLMATVRQAMDGFSKEQMNIYDVRATAAAHERILTTSGIDVLCVLVAALMIGSSCYSFVICRRQFRKVAEADTRIHSVIENILDGMITVNADGAVRAMNPAARKMFGYGENDFQGDFFDHLIPQRFDPEMDGELSSCRWGQLVEHTGSITLALARTRNAATFPVELSLNEMVVDKERFYVAMIRDVTERKRFEEALKAEKNSLAVTLGSIGDGVITTDLHGNVLITNAACEALTGWTAADSAGQKLSTVLNITADSTTKPKDQRKAYRSEAEAILLGAPERATLTARDGTQRVIEQMAAPISDGKDALCGVVLVFRDITQRLRDESERRKTETLDQLGLLAGGIAHDFNNLLTAIIGNISLISLILPGDEQLNERLNDAKNASLRARDLAQQLLTFARGGAPIKQTASAAKLIEETVSFSLRGAQSRSEITITPDLWPAEFDSGQISQVIGNLVVNAEQAMPDGGTLYVNCDNYSATGATDNQPGDLKPGDYIRIRLRDEGTGIPEQCLKRIFDPYYTTKSKGNGLGLATAYSIIKNHGGLITVESQLHEGATFTIYLPALLAQPAVVPGPAVAEVKETPQEIKGFGRVLIVDDEEAIRMLVEFALTRLGYEVDQAETALQGIDLYRQSLSEKRRYDLVILDLTLPGGMGGKEALKNLIEIDPTVNAIVSSGYATDATMSRFEDFGFRGVIAKPYEAAALGRMVHDTIESSRAELGPYELQHAC